MDENSQSYPAGIPLHARPAAKMLEAFATSAEGLGSDEARRRRAAHGPNALPQARGQNPLLRLLKQFQNPLIGFLLLAAVAAWLLGHVVDASVIVAVVLVNALVGFVQEGKAEQALDAIRSMVSPKASVRRDGQRAQRRRPRTSCPATSCCWSPATACRPTCGWSGAEPADRRGRC